MSQTLDFDAKCVDIRTRTTSEITININFKDTNGDLIDLTGRVYTASAVRDTETPIAFTINTTAAASGVITLTTSFDDAQHGSWRWELWQNTSGQDRPLLAGTIFVAEKET